MDSLTLSLHSPTHSEPHSEPSESTPKHDVDEFNMPKFHPEELPSPSMTATTPVTKRPRAKSLGAIIGQAASNNNPRLVLSHARSRMSAPLIDAFADQPVESDTPTTVSERRRRSYPTSPMTTRIDEREEEEEHTDEENINLI